MSGKYLLDTNIIIALFANEAAVQKPLAKAKEVFVPSIALGELYYGAQNSKHQKANLKRIDGFAGGNSILLPMPILQSSMVLLSPDLRKRANRFQKTIFGLRHWLCNIS